MEFTANAGKYKIIEYLVNEPEYQAFIAVNIEKSTNDQVLINRYRGANEVRHAAPVIYDIARANTDEFVESFSEYGALSAVFTYRRGVSINKVLTLKKQEQDVRLSLAKSLMHSALTQVVYPMHVRNAGLLSENVILDIPNRLVFFNRVIRPDTEALYSLEQRMLSKHLPVLYKKDIFAPDAYWDFIDKLNENGYVNMAEAFSSWCVCLVELEQSIAKLQKPGKLALLIPAIKRHLKRKTVKRRKARLEHVALDDITQNRNISI